MPYNEEDTKLHLITPALQAQQWCSARITMEYPITAGQIILHGDSHEQLSPTRADYLLRYAESLPIAIVEAKGEEYASGAGLQRAKNYAEKLGCSLPFRRMDTPSSFGILRPTPSKPWRWMPFLPQRRYGNANVTSKRC